jgi:hypothetical protein
LVLEVVADGIEALLALGLRLVGALPGDMPGVQALTAALAHFAAGQAGPHGPEEEFVIVERVHGITGERVKS